MQYRHIHTYICIHTYVYTYIYTYTCIHKHTHICICICIHMHIRTSGTVVHYKAALEALRHSSAERGWEGLPKMDLNLSLILLSTTSSRLSSCSPRASPPHQLVESVRLSSLDASSPAHPCKEQRAGCHRLTEHLQWPATRQRT